MAFQENCIVLKICHFIYEKEEEEEVGEESRIVYCIRIGALASPVFEEYILHRRIYSPRDLKSLLSYFELYIMEYWCM